MAVSVRNTDLNLLVYLDILLKEKSVTRAAEQLGLTQPAMSNALKRLREVFNDPILIRTNQGMTATEKALSLQPEIRKLVLEMQTLLEPNQDFQAQDSRRVFRIMCSDYAEATLLPAMIKRMREEAPGIILDCLTPSDVSYQDLEQGHVDMAINRFNDMPASFHQKTIWRDSFSCLLNADNPMAKKFNLKTYLQAQHVWVSKTGMGVGLGVNPEHQSGLGWIDKALEKLGHKRQISIFTRHYTMPALLVMNNDLIATLPTKVAVMYAANPALVLKAPPFSIPEFELKMAWSPLLHHSAAHRWLRGLIMQSSSHASGHAE